MAGFETGGALTGEGKMYGVLVGRDHHDETVTLQAFSGRMDGAQGLEGWAPLPALPAAVEASERRTLARLTAIRVELERLAENDPTPQREEARAGFAARVGALDATHRARKADRHRARQAGGPQESLDEQSRRDGMEMRRLKAERADALGPLDAEVVDHQARVQALRTERKQLSRALQAEMHGATELANLAGEPVALQAAFGPDGIPTGTGECCAPKLLQEAARRGLRPTGLAEFWWGPAPADGGRAPGVFYGACTDRCIPIMGHLLCGIDRPAASFVPPGPSRDVEVLFRDAHLIVVDKPHGLLSVPGRGATGRDCVVTRLTRRLDVTVLPVHRLDMDTSGLMVLALTTDAQRALSAQFEQRQVAKRYAAILSGHPAAPEGTIELPLRADRGDRPRQVVAVDGKPAVTRYERTDQTRVTLWPRTGRTHQLRVHCAHPDGLGHAIAGDRLYGDPDAADRLMLHAAALSFEHPATGERLHFESEEPFA